MGETERPQAAEDWEGRNGIATYDHSEILNIADENCMTDSMESCVTDTHRIGSFK